jgi:hypothetical protein
MQDGSILMHLVGGRYKCNWCGADLDLEFTARETIEILTQHEGVDLRIIVVGEEEHHRCERPTPAN